MAAIIEERANVQTHAFRTDWERVRWLAAAMLQPHLKKGTNLKATDLITFDWEKKSVPEKSDKSRKEMFAKWDAEMKKKYGK